MSFSLSRASLPAFETAFRAASGVLDKGEAFAVAKKIEPSVLLQARLAPDMFPLVRQIQIATDIAKNGAARLAGVEPPKFEDVEASFAELKARLEKGIAFLKSVDPSKIDASVDRVIRFPIGPGKLGEMAGADYLNFFVTPNVYFHLTTAYAILRHCGVEIGKTDFLGAIPVKIV